MTQTMQWLRVSNTQFPCKTFECIVHYLHAIHQQLNNANNDMCHVGPTRFQMKVGPRALTRSGPIFPKYRTYVATLIKSNLNK